MELLIATNNSYKIREIKQKLSCLEGLTLVTPQEIGIEIYPEENGATFKDNAEIKAKAFFGAAGIPVIADDSGLEVEQLNGLPGVNSARYAGDGSTDKENRNKLISVLDFSKDTSARFHCVICLYDGDLKNFSHGTVHGKIIPNERGNNGFGYDAIFIPDGYHETFAEMLPELKNEISHRANALEELQNFLYSHINVYFKPSN